MPPWLPAPGYGDFVDERRLSDVQIARIAEWIGEGAPEGLGAGTPPLPRGHGWLAVRALRT